MVRFYFKIYRKSPRSRISFFCSDECRKMSFDRMGEKYV